MDDGYSGAAVLTVDGREIPVQVLLDAKHEPVDGRLHWFGRLSFDRADPELEQALAAVTGTVELRTGEHRAQARIGDVDPWGRYRVTGIGPPPFPLDEPALDD
jgi:hypothetical protein